MYVPRGQPNRSGNLKDENGTQTEAGRLQPAQMDQDGKAPTRKLKIALQDVAMAQASSQSTPDLHLGARSCETSRLINAESARDRNND